MSSRYQYSPEDMEEWRREQAAHRAALIEEGTCPECGGDGEYPGPTPSHWGEPKYYKCSNCGGSGKYSPEDDE